MGHLFLFDQNANVNISTKSLTRDVSLPRQDKRRQVSQLTTHIHNPSARSGGNSLKKSEISKSDISDLFIEYGQSTRSIARQRPPAAQEHASGIKYRK